MPAAGTLQGRVGAGGSKSRWCQVSPMPSSTQADFILPVELIFEAKTKVSESFWGHMTPAPQLERFSFSALTRQNLCHMTIRRPSYDQKMGPYG